MQNNTITNTKNTIAKGKSKRLKGKMERGSTKRSRQVALSVTKDRYKSNGTFTLSVGENLGAFSLNAVYILNLQSAFERVVDYGFHQRLQL